MVKIVLISLILPFIGAAQDRGTALVNGMAELKCNFQVPHNYSRDSLTLYWQRNAEVVFTMFQGKEENERNDMNFRSLRRVLQKNGDLLMYNVSLVHKGEYTCYVLQRTNWIEKKHESRFLLEVLANYSVPEISSGSSVDQVENGTTLVLKCSSGHGFPKPHRIVWEMSYENRTRRTIDPHPQILNTSGTFNVSSNLPLKVEEDVNITCLVESHHNVSQDLQIVVKKKTPQVVADQNLIIIISVIFIVSFTVLSVVLLVMKRKQSRSRGARGRDQEAGPSCATTTDPPEQLIPLTSHHMTATDS